MSMFGKRKNARPFIDITKKEVKTWWGGTKLVPTSKAEQRRMKDELRKHASDCIVIDGAYKKRHELDWIDRIEEFDAIWDD